MPILLSIIIPTYNRKNFVVRSIESVLSQMDETYEIVVVDDGSIDGTKLLLLPYIEKGLIKYIYQENSGKPSVARNTGINNSSGDWICFLDSDDYLLEKSISKRLNALLNFEDVSLVCSDWLQLDSRNNASGLVPSWVNSKNYVNKINKKLIFTTHSEITVFKNQIAFELLNKNFINTSSVIVNKNVLVNVGLFDESLTIAEDRDLWLKICDVSKVVFIKEPLVVCEKHNGNITKSDVLFNFEQDQIAIERFCSKKRPMSYGNKKILNNSLSEFFFEYGYFHFKNSDYLNSRILFFKALLYRPLSMINIKYFLISLFPEKIIEYAKNVSSRLRSEVR
ncbi:MAG: glycosyltransferase [Paludibacter sp.]|nr:glycosyltransferase [Paludibacter sp.]